MLLWLGMGQMEGDKDFFSTLLLILLGTTFIGIAFYISLNYVGQIPVIHIDKGNISFSIFGSGQIYYLRDVAEVKQGIQVPLKVIFTFQVPGTEIRFENGDVRYIYERMYANAWQINCWIEDVLIKRRNLRDFDEPLSYAKVLPDEPFEKIQESGLFTKTGYSFMGLGLFALYFMLIKPESALSLDRLVYLIGFLALFVWLFNRLMPVVYLSKKYIQIKRPLSYSPPEIFELSKIRKISIEAPKPYLPYALQVLTESHKRYRYHIGSLRKKDWKALEEELEKEGVEVEGIF